MHASNLISLSLSRKVLCLYLILEDFSYQESHSASSGDCDGPPVGHVQHTIEGDTHHEPYTCCHHTVEHGGVDCVLHHLLLQLPDQVPLSYKDSYDPQERDEKDVKSTEEDKEPSNWRHPAIMLCP